MRSLLGVETSVLPVVIIFSTAVSHFWSDELGLPAKEIFKVKRQPSATIIILFIMYFFMSALEQSKVEHHPCHGHFGKYSWVLCGAGTSFCPCVGKNQDTHHAAQSVRKSWSAAATCSVQVLRIGLCFRNWTLNFEES